VGLTVEIKNQARYQNYEQYSNANIAHFPNVTIIVVLTNRRTGIVENLLLTKMDLYWRPTLQKTVPIAKPIRRYIATRSQ